MTGLELVVGYLVAWGVRKARRVGRRADDEVDAVLDAGMARLHGFVAGRLGGDPALARLDDESADGTVSERTRDRVRLALEDAVEDDPGFGAALDGLLDQVRTADSQVGSGVAVAGGVAVVGGVSIRAESGGVAAWTVGDVHLGGPPGPSRPGPADG